MQTIELVGTQVNEVQLVQTSTSDYPEVQVVEVSSPVVNEVQLIGVILQNVNIPASCSVQHNCPLVENNMKGLFSLKFDPNQCGTVSDNSDSNWCTIALKDMGFQLSDYACSATSCTTGLMSFRDPNVIQQQLCALRGGRSTKSFMVDAHGNCAIAVNKWSMVLTGGSSGVYLLAYNLTFQVSCALNPRLDWKLL